MYDKMKTKMKRTIIFLIGAIATLGLSSCHNNKTSEIDSIIEKGLTRATEQAKFLAQSLMNQPDKLPRSFENDTLVTSDSRWWCSGFFAGTLWMLYENQPNDTLKQYAENYTLRVEKEQYTKSTHDLGFMMYCSFGNGYRLTGNKHYEAVLLQSANSLASRFNKKAGVIRSWDNKPKWKYPVIIDNMMNLELLEEVYKLSNNALLDTIANSHALNTMKNHFRQDYSSCHVVDYDTISGQAIKQQTHQGYSDTSAWARGQAWGLYGYTMMYRETKNPVYLEQATHIAHFILNHHNLPADKIPYWDFDAADIPNAPRDASAAAVMASSLIELSQYVNDKNLSNEYLATACQQIKVLTSDEYLAQSGTNGGFILKHSVGNYPRNSEVDVPLTYTDYYYVEALIRYKNLKNKQTNIQ